MGLKVLCRDDQGALSYQDLADAGAIAADANGGLVITDGEIGFDATVAGKNVTNTNGVLSVDMPGFKAKVGIATVGAGVLTAAAIVSGLIMRTGPTGAYNDTTDTATAIIAALDNPADNDSFDFTIVNGVAYAGTMVAGADVTLAGTTANAASKVRRYRCTVTSVAAHTVTITGIGEMAA